MEGIKINCRRVYDSGEFYQKKMEDLIEIHKKLIGISNAINENWEGNDANNFRASFNTHINKMPNLIKFLEENAMVLKNNALEHSQIDNDFANNMERRSELNGYYREDKYR